MDLISRKALCNDLREYKVHPVPISSDESEVKGYNDGIDLAISVIAELPSAEPKIIYCKDCDQYNPEAQFCDLLQFNFLPEGHCSWGRRKERK